MSEDYVYGPKDIKIPDNKSKQWAEYWRTFKNIQKEKAKDRLAFQKRYLRACQASKATPLDPNTVEAWARIFFLGAIPAEKAEAEIFNLHLATLDIRNPIGEISIHENLNAETFAKLEKCADHFRGISETTPHRLKLFARGVAWNIQNCLPDEILYVDENRLIKNEAIEDAILAVLSNPDTYRGFADRIQSRIKEPGNKRRPDRELVHAIYKIACRWKEMGLTVSKKEGSRFYVAAILFLKACGIRPGNLERTIEKIKRAL